MKLLEALRAGSSGIRVDSPAQLVVVKDAEEKAELRDEAAGVGWWFFLSPGPHLDLGLPDAGELADERADEQVGVTIEDRPLGGVAAGHDRALEIGAMAGLDLLHAGRAPALAFALLYHAGEVIPMLATGLLLEIGLVTGREPTAELEQ